ncbi:MAG: AEC family transporter [Actinobacteria bacterium]|nr:MAG: AEC family transporter [Actinomycetota bacterium]REK40233.1 MAG: AEC family transporter [Actinomycetota bacterium]
MPELALIFIDTLVPVFLIVGLGYWIGPRLQIEARSLARSAYYVFAPAFIFQILSVADLAADVVFRVVGALVLTTLLTGALAFVAGRMLGRGGEVTAALILVAVYGNVGNFGLPVVTFAFGEQALPLAGIAFLTVNAMAFLVGVTAATWHKSSPLRAFGTALRTPALLVAIPAVLVNVGDATLPLFADRAIGLLADAMIPVMLLTLGIQLAAMGRPHISFDVVLGSSFRLVLAPAITALLVFGMSLESADAGVTIVQSAMPAAVFSSIIAIEHDLVPDLVTTTVLFTTIASAVTLALLLVLL